MIPTITIVRLNQQARNDLPLLVLGPSLGTSAATLWWTCAQELAEDFDVVAWDLPGHGDNRNVPDEGFTIAELATGVVRSIDEVSAARGQPGGAFLYAGDSVGGLVGTQLARDAGERLRGVVLLCTGPHVGTRESWAERIEQVRRSGTAGLVASSAQRWFGPGFLQSHPDRGSALLHALQAVDDRGYIAVCRAIADFDASEWLDQIAVPVLAVAGSDDTATPPDLLRILADGVQNGSFVELEGVAHLAPIERPSDVAALIRQLAGAPFAKDGPSHLSAGHPDDPLYDAGMRVRRAVLGGAHVDRATAATTDLTADFQDFITRYAWGSVWTRGGLDRRSRSMITLTALIAHGHDDELAMHLRAARRNGLTWDEIREVLLHAAVYCGVPAANTAFRIAQQILDEESD